MLLIMSGMLYGQNKDQEFQNIKLKIDSAYYTFDAKLLKKLIKISIQLKKKYPDDWLPSYYSGILYLQLGKILYLPNPDAAYIYFDKSLDNLLNAESKINSAEINALISSAYGKKSSLSTIKAIYFGLKARDYIYKAGEIDSSNVKVLLVAATHLMHTPETFGGDKKWAEELLLKALKNAEKNGKNGDNAVKWASAAEINAYLAQLEILRNNKVKARQYIDEALKLMPSYGFVHKDLIPQLNRLK